MEKEKKNYATTQYGTLKEARGKKGWFDNWHSLQLQGAGYNPGVKCNTIARIRGTSEDPPLAAWG